MNYWLIKSEPSVFSIDDMQIKGTEPWNGVRNYQARNNMKAMKEGDICFFYHSNCKDAGIVGLVCVDKEYYPDPDDHRFVCVDVRFVEKTGFLPLKTLKTYDNLSHLALFHQSRLSVQPIDAISSEFILKILSGSHSNRSKNFKKTEFFD